MIKGLEQSSQPREKALLNGIESLTDEELLALLLRTGDKEQSVLDLSSTILREIHGMNGFHTITFAKLLSFKGINKAKAIGIMAALEFSKRINNHTNINEVYDSPTKVFYHLETKMSYLSQEHFLIMILDNHNRLIAEKTLFIGSVNMSIVSAREIFREALAFNGVSIICVHNHPSGDAHPSSEDISMTQKLVDLGKMMNVDIVDHIIIGRNQYYSFKAEKVYSSIL